MMMMMIVADIVRSCVMQVLWFMLLLIDPSSGQRSADSLQLLTECSRGQT